MDIIFDRSVRDGSELIPEIQEGIDKIESLCGGNASTVVHVTRETADICAVKISVRAFHKTFFVEAKAGDYISGFKHAKRRLLSVLKKQKNRFIASRRIEHMPEYVPEYASESPPAVKQGA